MTLMKRASAKRTACPPQQLASSEVPVDDDFGVPHEPDDDVQPLDHNIERVRQANKRRESAAQGGPASRSEAIHRALVALGDPSARSRDVAAYVRQTWPELAAWVDAPHWHPAVTQARDRAAKALGVERREIAVGGRRSEPPGAATEVTVPHLLDLLRVRSLLKDPNDLPEVVAILSALNPPQRMTQTTAALDQLLERHAGNGPALQTFLEDLQRLGIRVSP